MTAPLCPGIVSGRDDVGQRLGLGSLKNVIGVDIVLIV
jgi:hypothetical protein